MVHWNHPTDERQDIGKDQKVKQSQKLTRWKWLLKILYLFGQFLNFQGHQAAWSPQRSNQSATVQLCRVIHQLKLARILIMITVVGCYFLRASELTNEPAPTCFSQQQRPTIFSGCGAFALYFWGNRVLNEPFFCKFLLLPLALCFLQFYLSSHLVLACAECAMSVPRRGSEISSSDVCSFVYSFATDADLPC